MRDTLLFRKDRDPPPPWYVELELTPTELQALGHVTAQWALTEHLIREHSIFLLALAGVPFLPEIDNGSFRKRKHIWEEIVGQALADKPDDLADTVALIVRVGSMAHERHKLIHGLIVWNESDRHRLKVFSRKNLRQIPWIIDKKRINEIAQKIAALNYDFLTLHGGLVFAPSASRRNPGKPIPTEASKFARPYRLRSPAKRKRQPKSSPK